MTSGTLVPFDNFLDMIKLLEVYTKEEIFMSNIQIQGDGNKVKGDTNKIKISISIGTVVVALFAIIVFFSASNSIENKIIGSWQINEQPQIIVTFGDNNSFSMSGDGDYLEGNYLFLSDNKVQAHMKYLWADFIISGDISIQGDTMNVTNMSDPDDIFGADGANITLKKIK